MFPLIPLLLSVAPTVASWIAGDSAGNAAAKVAGIAREVLGTDDASAVERAIAADPAKALEFKLAVIQAEAADKAAARAAEAQALTSQLEAIKAAIADTQSARAQTVELAKSGSLIAWGSVVVSVIVLGAFGVLLFVMATQELPAANREILAGFLNVLGTLAVGVVSYWVGSSVGSFQKTNIIAAKPAGKP
jgi:hypothetical protein